MSENSVMAAQAWHPADVIPPAPGFYWTREIMRVERLPNHVRQITYTQTWLKWTGEEWLGELTDWHGEGK